MATHAKTVKIDNHIFYTRVIDEKVHNFIVTGGCGFIGSHL